MSIVALTETEFFLSFVDGPNCDLLPVVAILVSIYSFLVLISAN